MYFGGWDGPFVNDACCLPFSTYFKSTKYQIVDVSVFSYMTFEAGEKFKCNFVGTLIRIKKM